MCESLESFPDNELLNLTSLKELVLKRCPNSLVNLSLYDGATSCSRFSHLLPSSLSSPLTHEFVKLESVSMGLQHLPLSNFSGLGTALNDVAFTFKIIYRWLSKTERKIQ